MDAFHIIGQHQITTSERINVHNAFDNELVGSLSLGSQEHVDQAVKEAKDALKRTFPTHARVSALYAAADLLEAHANEIATLLALEGSKTITEAQREPLRSAEILRMSAEVARTLSGETLPFDARPGSESKVGYYVRKPVGVVACILPFNDPIALVAHKVGPAIAAGNAVVLKPDPRSSLSVVRVCELLLQAGIPTGRINVITGNGAVGQALVEHDDVRMVSFTGGMKTGEQITRSAGIKKLALELGSNSPVIVLSDADLDAAAQAVSEGAFAQAGQNCLGVQRVFVQQSVYEAFVLKLVGLAQGLKAGHSMDPEVDVCQMIRLSEADRVQSWIEAAVLGGARVLCGANQNGSVLDATVLENVPETAHLCCHEVYGPVVGLYPIHSLEEAVQKANAVDVGLHGAVFTENLRNAFYVAEHLEVGAVMVNETTDYRLDTMPFGGTKKSGIGREGVRFAAHEMSETRVVCFNL